MAAQVSKAPTCNIHPEEAMILFCLTCDENVCTTCVIENSHSQHKLCKPHQILEIKKKEFKELMERDDKIHEHISTQIKSMKRHKSTVNDHQSQTSTAIEKRSEKLVQMIEKEKQALLLRSKRLHDQQLNLLSDQESVVERCLASLEKYERDQESFLQLTHEEEILKVVRDLKLIQVYKLPTDINAVVSFDTRLEVTEGDIKKVFGTLTEQTTSNEKREHAHKQTEQIKKYRLKLEDRHRISNRPRVAITKISPIDMNTAFVLIGDFYMYRVQLNDEHEIVLGKEVARAVRDISHVVDQCVYLCTGTQVKLCTMNEDMYLLYDVSPDIARCVALTKEGRVLVCCKESDGTNKQSHSKLHVFQRTGITDITGNPICREAGFMYRIGQHCGEPCYLGQGLEGGSIQTDRAGKPYLKRYTGNLGSYPEKAFDPRGICFDDKDQIIIADYTNNALHLLGKDFQFKNFLLREWDGLKEPTAITLYNGFLWIGQEDGTIQIRKYEP